VVSKAGVYLGVHVLKKGGPISYILNDVRRTAAGRLLMVGYTRRRQGDVENIRIITARPPSRKERATYTAARD
jgi:hypothetical protein